MGFGGGKSNGVITSYKANAVRISAGSCEGWGDGWISRASLRYTMKVNRG